MLSDLLKIIQQIRGRIQMQAVLTCNLYAVPPVPEARRPKVMDALPGRNTGLWWKSPPIAKREGRREGERKENTERKEEGRKEGSKGEKKHNISMGDAG